MNNYNNPNNNIYNASMNNGYRSSNTGYNQQFYNWGRTAMPFSTPRGNFTQNQRNNGTNFIKTTGKSLTLSRFLDSTQNVISTVNQAIPIYQQVKPMFANSKLLTSALKKVFPMREEKQNVTHTTKTKPVEPVIINSEKKSNLFKEQRDPNKPLF